MNNLKELLPLVLLAGVYVLFSQMKGFEGEIQKLLKLKGMQNVIVQSILFVVVVVTAQYVYYHVIGEDIYEGQDEEEFFDEEPIEEEPIEEEPIDESV